MMKDRFIKLYQNFITRPGADKLLAWLETTDFFEAPASTRFHLSRPGGLVEHSIQEPCPADCPGSDGEAQCGAHQAPADGRRGGELQVVHLQGQPCARGPPPSERKDIPVG